jgi:hypothetical protein
MSRISKRYYLWWNNREFLHLALLDDVIVHEGAYVASANYGRTVYGVIKGHQYISINKVDVPKELLAGMLVLGVPT